MSRGGRDAGKTQEIVLGKCLAEPGNDVCADCGARSPSWASVTLGVFLCIRCAGIHRQIGVHVTLVKSVNLDTWKPEQIQKLQATGNLRAAQIYEANVPASARPNPNDQYSVEQWIRNKYERKLYLDKSGASSPSPSPSPTPAAVARTQAAHATAHRRTKSRDEASSVWECSFLLYCCCFIFVLTSLFLFFFFFFSS